MHSLKQGGIQIKKLAILLLAVCFAAMCAVPALAEASHSVTTEGKAVTITIGGSIDEEVTLQIKEAGGTKPVYLNQTAADSDGAVFETELASGEYTYRAYLNDSDEYVEGTFKVEEKVEPPTSDPDKEDPTDPSEDPTDPSEDPTDSSEDPTIPSQDPSDSTEDTSATDSTEDPTATGDTGSTDGTSSPADEDPGKEGPETGDRGLMAPLVLMLVSGSLLVATIMLKPKAGGKYAKKE